MCRFSRKKKNTAKERPAGAGLFLSRRRTEPSGPERMIVTGDADLDQQPCFLLTPHSHSFTNPHLGEPGPPQHKPPHPYLPGQHCRRPPWSQPHPPSTSSGMTVCGRPQSNTHSPSWSAAPCVPGEDSLLHPLQIPQSLTSRGRAPQLSSQLCGSWSEGERLVGVPPPIPGTRQKEPSKPWRRRYGVCRPKFCLPGYLYI